MRNLIRTLKLRAHPEGGFYRETWRSAGSARFPGYRGRRSFATSILFLLPAGSLSRWHRVASDELWCWQGGGAIELVELGSRVRRVRIGPGRRDRLQHVVPADTWFAARPSAGVRYGLVGCVVAPGFSFADFELADAVRLLRSFPRAAAVIRSFSGKSSPRG